MKFSLRVGVIGMLGSILLIGMQTTTFAQLPAGNADGVATGHIHLSVPDAEKHRQIFLNLGAEEVSAGRLQLLKFPGMFFILTEREPTGPSDGSSVNHIGFRVQDIDAYRVKALAHGATIVVDNPEAGVLVVEHPDGARIEFQPSESIENPIEFHHIHLYTPRDEEIRDWYVEMFGAEESSRGDFLSAVVPGGRVDIRATDEAAAPTQGRAIDHIGFEVDDLDAFAEKLKAKGVKFDREVTDIPAIGLKIAFITDPIGTYIELTEGLADY